jgi:fructuronate reductase
VAPEDPGAVLEALAHPQARIASLTVTEKGYLRHPAGGGLWREHPDTAHDLAHPQAPRSAVGFLVHGLALRRVRGLGPLTLLSLDNLPANGQTLRGLVLALAGAVDPALERWIAAHCTFPNSMVDRIVPRTTEADRTRVEQALGAQDAWPVLAEPFFDWAVEDHFAAGRPAWDAGGARFVADAAPWEQLKLRMVNGSHSAIAYLGATAGWATVDKAVAQPALRRYLEALLREEVAPTLPPLPGLDAGAYRERLLERFANPALAHRTQQIAMDGSQKLPQRLLGTVRDRLAAGAPIDRLALAVAAWLHYLRGADEAGQAYPVDDPQAAELGMLHQQAQAAGDFTAQAACFTRYGPVFGDLADQAALVAALAGALQSLQQRGVRGTLEALH